jgi:protein-S-isoprenylcysteine O-methyltransferase Ste14
MKPRSFLLALIVGSTLFFLIPLFLIKVNTLLGLPVLLYPTLKIIGVSCMLVGIAIILYCSGVFFFLGKGTPVPIEPPRKLVVVGLYKYSRNPIYLAYELILFGEFLSLGSVLLFGYFLASLFFHHLFVVRIEEPSLKKRFGEDYLEYCKKTPRWL